MDNRAKDLLEKYQLKNASDEEQKLLEEWFWRYSLNESSSLSDEVHLQSKDKIWNNISALTKPKPSRSWLWKPVAVAAAVILLLTSTLYFVQVFNEQTAIPKSALSKPDVEPGRTGATLTLSNGKKIDLTKIKLGQSVVEAGMRVSKTAEGLIVYSKSKKSTPDVVNTIETAPGEAFQLQLPDGSKVWLNASTKLSYVTIPSKNGQRLATLSGEAYFEIAKDEQHPFIVKTDKQIVEVLGTHFSINNYADEPLMKTTLLEGSLRVSVTHSSKIIKPGEQLISDGSNTQIKKTDDRHAIDWKNGDFNLENIDFPELMRKLARWYNIDVIYESEVPKRLIAGGWISRKKNLSAVLKAIENSGIATFRIEGRKVYVSN